MATKLKERECNVAMLKRMSRDRTGVCLGLFPVQLDGRFSQSERTLQWIGSPY